LDSLRTRLRKSYSKEKVKDTATDGQDTLTRNPTDRKEHEQ
jgi:hypothetical protein